MKTKIYIPLAALCGIAMMTGCDENAWNDHLDGFDSNFNPTQVETINYTLTDEDYVAIANNSTNKQIAKEAGNSKALENLSKNLYFTDKITAQEYVPAFLASTNSQFYTLSNGSAIKVTYKMAVGLPEEVTEAVGATEVRVRDDFYKANVWESDENYISAFAPDKPASKFLPKFLLEQLPDAQEGDYAVVSYAQADQNPIFGNVGGSDTPFEMSNVLANVTKEQEISVNGVVTGSCGAGYVISDKAGAILVYMGGGFDAGTYPIGTQLNVAGTVDAFNNGLQLTSSATVKKLGSEDYKFPAPKVMDGAALDALKADPKNRLAIYASVSGEMSVGTYTNLIVPGAKNTKISPYYVSSDQKKLLTDKAKVTLVGWIVSCSKSGICNFVVNDIKLDGGAATTAIGTLSLAAEVPTTSLNAIYRFDGTKWSVPSDMAVLNPGDYTAMGQSHPNLTEPDNYLPAYCRQKFPYAAAKDSKFIVYKFYNGSSTVLACANYVYNGTEWVKNDGVETITSQFVRTNGVWKFDPSVTINLPETSTFATNFYQSCVDWVYQTKCVPLGDTSIKSGKFWVSKYGNNEVYSGASAFKNDVDLRPGAAVTQYAAGWEGKTDAEIIAGLKHNFAYETLPAVLAEYYPDAVPIEGVEVLYTVNFDAFDGSRHPSTIVYEVTGPAKFEVKSENWGI